MGSVRSQLEGWQPPAQVRVDVMERSPAAALAAVLDRPLADALPPLWHWAYFLDWPVQRDLGPDGHPAAGGLLPPLVERTRMWAGGSLAVQGPLLLGTPAERSSRVSDVTVKDGRTGELAFVTVRHEVRQEGTLRLVEEQSLVYRSGMVPRPTPPVGDVPGPAPWERPLETDPVLLFRFGALTANAHRIHYDGAYATGVEGYPGLVVHGPLLALLMAELVRERADRPLAAFRYRLLQPAFAGAPLTLAGGPADDTAWTAVRSAGAEHARAEVHFA